MFSSVFCLIASEATLSFYLFIYLLISPSLRQDSFIRSPQSLCPSPPHPALSSFACPPLPLPPPLVRRRLSQSRCWLSQLHGPRLCDGPLQEFKAPFWHFLPSNCFFAVIKDGSRGGRRGGREVGEAEGVALTSPSEWAHWP